MRRPLPALSLALCALLSWVGTACRSGPPIRERVQLSPALEISAVAIYPFGFRWPEPAYRSFELSQRMFQVAEEKAGDAVLFFAPPDFRVFRPTDDNVWAASNLVALFPPYRVRPERAVVLRPWAEKRVVSSRRESINARGKAVGAGILEETTYLVHLEVLHPSTQVTMVQLDAEVTVDPFADRQTDEADPSPELTRVALSMTGRALELLAKHFHPPSTPRPLSLRYRFNPEAATTYSEEGRSSLELWLARQDPFEAEVLRLNRVRFANPGVDDTTATKILHLPGGLWVTDQPPKSALRSGDLITAIDGQPALPQALQRARFQPGPISLHVRRVDGLTADVSLP